MPLTSVRDKTMTKLLEFKTEVRNQLIEVVGSGMSLAGKWVQPVDVINAFAGMNITHSGLNVSVMYTRVPEVHENIMELFGKVFADAIQANVSGKNYMTLVDGTYLKQLGEDYVV